LHDERVKVDKELYGDVFRLAPRLTPLEARAIRLALEYVGPSIAAESHSPLDRVRKKLEETFGQFELAQSPQPRAEGDEEELVKTLSDGLDSHRLVEIEYLKEGEETPSTRLVEPYSFDREPPVWRVHTWDRTSGGARTYRLDRMRSARLSDQTFEPREGFDPNYLRDPRVARVWYSPKVAPWKLERGARPLTDKSAVTEVAFKTEDWVVGEILQDRGEAVVLEPSDLRSTIAKRAGQLARELKVSRVRAKT
jgi:predicted DNA-binding transcriptional regulator YafY